MDYQPMPASAQELQQEIAFFQVLLDTLDVDSESYWKDKREREDHIDRLQARLSSMSGPSQTNGQPFYSAPYQTHSAYQQYNDQPSLFLPSSLRKRPRNFDDPLAADHANKSSRTTPSPGATTPGTSSSADSFPELQEAFPVQRPGRVSSGTPQTGVRQAHSSLNYALEQQRQAAAQAAQERAAQERAAQSMQEAETAQAWDVQNYAVQQLHNQPRLPPPVPSGMASRSPHASLPSIQQVVTPLQSQRTTTPQSQHASFAQQRPTLPQPQRALPSQQMGREGSWHAPLRVPSQHSPTAQRSTPSQPIEPESSWRPPMRLPSNANHQNFGNTSRPPPYQASPGRSQPSQPIEIIDLCGDTDSDSDVQVISPQATRTSFQPETRPWSQTAFPPTGHFRQGNGYAPPAPPNFQANSTGSARTPGGQAIYNTLLEEFDDDLEIVEAPWTRGDFARGGPAQQHASMTTNPFGYPAPAHELGYLPAHNPALADYSDASNQNDREQTWRDRFAGYSYHDPQSTQEELRKLLGNIRPDEEIPPEFRLSTPEAMAVTLMEHQKLGVSWMKSMEDGSNNGSILADEMGLGKTVQALSLIVSRPSEDPRRKTTLVIAPVALMRQWEREIKTKVKQGRHALSVITYHGSSKKKSFRELSQYDVVLTSYGTVASEYSKRDRIRQFEARNADDPEGAPPKAKTEDYVLLAKDALWYRIVLDEAHNIRNKDTKTARACCELQATYRLCMTGTPMMNRTDELFGLIRFLRIPPYCDWTNFRRDIKSSLEKGTTGVRQDAIIKLQALLKAVLLRRTQESKIDGKVIFELPPKTVDRVHVTFDEAQQAFYSALEGKTQLKFNKYLKAGTVGKQYSHILVLLLRLRQACCHPHLLKDFAEPAADLPEEDMVDFARQLSDDVVSRLKAEDGAFNCPICLDGVENPAIFLPCGHNACRECFAMITSEPARPDEGYKCPNCRGKLDPKRITDYQSFKKVHMPGAHSDEDDLLIHVGTPDSDSDSEDDDDDESLNGFIVPDEEVDGSSSDRSKKSKGKAKIEGESRDVPKQKKTLAQLRREAHRNKASKRRYFKRLCKDWISSAKVDKTMAILGGIKAADPTEKTLVFSQFTSLLDILEVPLTRQRFDYTRLDGSMTPDMRNDSVNRFIDSPTCNVMLVSLKAGNAGLNLNAASQVIILDPFWNPYVEYQAIGRAHRLGQNRPVYVHRVLVPETVEDRIMALQKKKEELITAALDENAGRNISKLSHQELAFLFGVRGMPVRNGE